MRICSRCNASVNKTNIICPRCGFSLIRDKYGRRVYNINNNRTKYAKQSIKTLNRNDFNSSNKNLSVFVAIFILVFICTLIPIILTSFYFNKIDTSSNIMEADIELLKSYTTDVIRIATDYEKAWNIYTKDNTVALEEVAENLTLDIVDMTNDSCLLYNEYGKEKDLLSCVYKTYEDIDIYTKVNDDVSKLYNYVNDFEYGDVRTVLVDVYGYIYELYYLPESKDTYEEYKKEYSININALDNAFNNILEDKDL